VSTRIAPRGAHHLHSMAIQLHIDTSQTCSPQKEWEPNVVLDKGGAEAYQRHHHVPSPVEQGRPRGERRFSEASAESESALSPTFQKRLNEWNQVPGRELDIARREREANQSMYVDRSPSSPCTRPEKQHGWFSRTFGKFVRSKTTGSIDFREEFCSSGLRSRMMLSSEGGGIDMF
jgi:hypothetical protein